MLPLVPLAVLAATTVAGAAGARNIYKTKKNFDKIKEIREYIKKEDRRTLRLFRKAVVKAHDEVVEANSLVREVYQEKLPFLAYTFSLIKNLQYSLGNIEIESPNFDVKSLNQDINEIREIALGLGKSLITGAGSGAAAAYGVVTLVTTFGSASTGTAISTLSGVAAQNAMLAFLGGGSLAAGGGGVALGSVVLGGIVASPAILVGTYYISKKFEKSLEKMKKEKIKADKVFLERECSADILEEFAEVVKVYKDYLRNLSLVIDNEALIIREIVDKYGLDAKTYPEEALRKLVNTYKVMDIAVKTAKISPLNENGGIEKSFIEAVEAYSKQLPLAS